MTRPQPRIERRCPICQRPFRPKRRQLYDRVSCRKRADYLRAKRTGVCTHCADPVWPGGVTCAYHRRAAQLRVRIWTLRRRLGLQHPTTRAVRGELAELRSRWHAERHLQRVRARARIAEMIR